METEEFLDELKKIMDEHPEKYYNWIYLAEVKMNYFFKEVKNYCYNGKDIVHEIFRKILDEKNNRKKNRNKKKYPDIDIFMRMSINSGILNLYNKNKLRKTDCSYEFEKSDEEENADNSFFDNIESNTYPNQSDDYINKEIVENIKKKLEDDVECWFVCDEILKGNKNKEIADILGLSVNEVVNIKKRIIRKVRNNKRVK